MERKHIWPTSLRKDPTTIPKKIALVLKKFQDIMPSKLPKKLPTMREVDHEIELEPGARLPSIGPYRMAPPKLEELCKQLKELLEVDFIRPSKALYSAPVLFHARMMGHFECASTIGL